MRVVVIGKGHRFLEIARTFARKRYPVTAVSPDPTTAVELSSLDVPVVNGPLESVDLLQSRIVLDRQDLVIAAVDDAALLRTVIQRLVAQGTAAAITAVTSGEGASLQREFPEVDVRNEDLRGEGELHAILHKAATIRRVRRLRELANGARRLLILIFGNPDPDALASAIALKGLLRKNPDQMTVAYTGEVGRLENRAMMRMLSISAIPYEASMLASHEVIACVDCQPSFFTLQPAPRFDIVIDHHPRAIGPEAPFTDIRPRTGATSAILTEYYMQTGERMSRRVATALYYGLKVDTNNFQRSLAEEDIAALKFLYGHADKHLVRKIELSQFTANTLDYFGIALLRKRVVRDLVFAHLGLVESADVCVHIADFFMRMNEISWVIVGGIAGGRLVVVFRCDGYQKHAGRLAESAFAAIGSAGGHRTMARAEIELERVRDQVAGPSNETVEEFLVNRLAPHLRQVRRLQAEGSPPPRPVAPTRTK
ncbi:MAG: DHH family phosphoesterase [Planctomycetes bacterium]|nr:DHH family phosphoesterase [Planctomycetota bacterium]